VRINPAGQITGTFNPTPGIYPYSISSIVTRKDGYEWFANVGASLIGAVTPDGRVVEFAPPMLNSFVNSVALGPDGNLWFTESDESKVGVFRLSNQPPAASVIVRNASGQAVTAVSAGATFRLDASGTADPDLEDNQFLTYQWDFGNGVTNSSSGTRRGTP
jgi:hypothetical protein